MQVDLFFKLKAPEALHMYNFHLGIKLLVNILQVFL